MKLLLLTTLTLIAFAANSLLNRWALLDGSTGPASFAMIRLVSGAAMLMVLVTLQRGRAMPRFNPLPVAALGLYGIAFSFAYTVLDTGVGALILFGGVQITLFTIALAQKEPIGWARWVGAVLALAGLVILLWPQQSMPIDWGAAPLMVAGALGWGLYTFVGRGASDPLGETAANFLFAAPLGILVYLILPDAITVQGAVLAVIGGAITSGLGYALWYTVLPKFSTSVAAILQLTVPVIAAVFGIAILGEVLTVSFVIATVLVLAGTALAILC